jgi:hypothetical protein
MSFGNPWALFGIGAIAIPILLHLLGRQRVRVQRFPTLRFLQTSRLVPIRRLRLTDLMLLAIRVAILICAAVAIAKPRFDTSSRRAAREAIGSRRVARALIVDTSASMQRPTPGGQSAVAVARQRASELAGESAASTIIWTANPNAALAGAAAWLETQPAWREVLVVSDFQTGAVDSTEIALVPSGLGVKLERIGTVAGSATSMPVGARTVTRTETADRSIIEWSPEKPASPEMPVLLASGPALENARAALAAARAVVGTPALGHPVAIIYGSYPARAELARGASRIDEPWMGNAVARVASNRALTAAAAAVEENDSSDGFPKADARFDVVARNGKGKPVILASHGPVNGVDGLQLWISADAGSLASAALLAALPAAISPSAPSTELEPTAIDTERLARWERPTGASDGAFDPEASDGRWFWLAALILMTAEWLIRRRAAKGSSVSRVAMESIDRSTDGARRDVA